MLDAERISYRTLDVEHIGSVYETMMGFRLETAAGRSVAIKAAKKHGAPATIDMEAFLNEPPSKRAKWLRDRTDRKLTPKVGKAVRQITPHTGGTIDQLHAALDSVIDKNATPDLVPAGAMVLQPSQERRRSGSHYTPRELTEPIVRTALEPILNRLKEESDGPPHPEQVLDLKVCDPAMGSGAFLVEACRQLADTLINAWRAHDITPEIPPDEDETIYARRLVAQRCLYGVDRNPKSRRPRQTLTMAHNPRQRTPAHIPGPRPTPRRLARRPVDPPSCKPSTGKATPPYSKKDSKHYKDEPTSKPPPSCDSRSAKPTTR